MFHFQDKHVQEGNSASITCSLKEGDPPLSFAWVKDGDVAATLSGVKVVTLELSSILTIMEASSIHAGSYYCKASNPVSWALMQTKVLVDGNLGCVIVRKIRNSLCISVSPSRQ